MKKSRLLILLILIVIISIPLFSFDVKDLNPHNQNLWFWIISLFGFCFVLGILAVLAGVGGGVLFVPLVSSFFPFHLDYIRGAGLLVALAGAIAAGPGLLKRHYAHIRLALPVALVSSSFSIIGAIVGLLLPTTIIRIALGALIVGVAILLAVCRDVEMPQVKEQDSFGAIFHMFGTYHEESTHEWVSWKTHRTLPGLILFSFVGLIAGMFGLGAGWANVPVLNLVMGAPLKVAVGTSKFILSITDTTAAWIYINSGAVLPIIAVPSIIGLMLGSLIGVRLLTYAKPRVIRYIVILTLFFAGLRSIFKEIVELSF